jgi:cell division protein FtsN
MRIVRGILTASRLVFNMSREYRSRTRGSRRRAPEKTNSGNGIAWVAIGVLVGLVLAIVFYTKYQPEPAASGLKKQARLNHSVEATAKKIAAKAAAQAPEFDFYTLLPQKQTEAPAVTPTPTKVAVNNNPSSTSASGVASTSPGTDTANPGAAAVKNAKPTQAKRYMLQIAVMRTPSDADRLKAELTMQGFDVSVQHYVLNRETWYRINLGPYSSHQSALAQQNRLKGSNVHSILIEQ